MKIKVGINKTLFEKRLNLNIDRKEASKKIGISEFILTVIERGYLKVNKKYYDGFIKTYNLEANFFGDNYSYPVVINEEIYEPIQINKFFQKISNSKSFKIISPILAIIFIVLGVISICNIPKIKQNISSFFEPSILEIQKFVINNGNEEKKDSSIVQYLVLDKLYSTKNYHVKSENVEYVSINFYKKDLNLEYTFFRCKLTTSFENINYVIKYEHRYIEKNLVKIHTSIYKEADQTNKQIAHIIFDSNNNLDKSQNSYSGVYSFSQNGEGNKMLKPNDDLYKLYVNINEQSINTYKESIKEIFQKQYTGSEISYKTFNQTMSQSVTNLKRTTKTFQILTLLSFVLAILFLFCFEISMTEKRKIVKKLKRIEEEKIIQEQVIEYVENPEEENKREIPKNTWKNLLIPEFLVRVISLILLLVASIATYFLFISIVQQNIGQINNSITAKEMLSNLSVIGVMLLYFVKLDIYQNKKSAFAYNMFLFVTGLIYYLVLLFIYYGIIGVGTIASETIDSIFNSLPGNIIWGVLVYNLITILLFAPTKERFNNCKWKMIAFRVSVIIPFGYLIASSIISIGKTAFNWSLPYALSSFFFTKAPMITVFAVVYCAAVFIYRYITKKSFGEINGIIYQSGNRYNFIRNIYAAGTILVIGIVDLIFYFVYPTNSFGFGSNFWMLLAIPFVLFYHPHIGKRNRTWDTIFNMLYGFTYIAGILMIILAIFKILKMM